MMNWLVKRSLNISIIPIKRGFLYLTAVIDSVNMDALQAVYNNAGLNLTNQNVEQANKLNAVCNMSAS